MFEVSNNIRMVYFFHYIQFSQPDFLWLNISINKIYLFDRSQHSSFDIHGLPNFSTLDDWSFFPFFKAIFNIAKVLLE